MEVIINSGFTRRSLSPVIDKYGLFGMQQHPLSIGRMAGAVLMVAGIYLISKF